MAQLSWSSIVKIGQPFNSCFSLPTNKNGHLSLCTSCSRNKAHRQTFNTHGLTSTAPMELIYKDVWGPSHDIGIDGSKYYVIFVDHYTKYI